VVLGMKAAGWASNRGKARFTVLALDTAGKPLKGQAVEVRGRLSQIISTRKRMVGGFYAYDNRTEVKDLGALCSGSTDDRGLLLCEASAGQRRPGGTGGQRRRTARPCGAGGHQHLGHAQGELWFEQDNDDRIDVLPEKKAYEGGETARLQVRMPFREATALVAVEREGVIDTQVVTLRGDDPTFELKIDKGWAPNVYVSVLALRGRIREVPWYSASSAGAGRRRWNGRAPSGTKAANGQAPTAMVDLAKPAFKLGVAALKVGTAAHELQVTVTPDKPQYTMRGKALVRVKVTQGGQAGARRRTGLCRGRRRPAGAARQRQLAAAAGADPPARLGRADGHGAQSEIIGRRHYGRKAVAAGGGGGKGAHASCSTPCCCGSPRGPAGRQGEALIEVPLNDSLTSPSAWWRWPMPACSSSAPAAPASRSRRTCRCCRACRRWCATATASARC
jgi:hypothetical protein